MRYRKFISTWALLALMFGQITLAEHSASHSDYSFSKTIVAAHSGHDGHQHDEGNQNHECPECVLTQSLQAAFYNTPVTFTNIAQPSDLIPVHDYITIIAKRVIAHSPRAPPTLLI